MCLGQIFTRSPLALHEIGNCVKSETIYAQIQPEFHYFPQRLKNRRIVEIQIGLMAEKSVPVVGLRNGIPGPVGRLCVDKNDPHALITSVRLTPYVPIPFGVFAGASCFFKPRVLVRSMIQDHFDDDTYPPIMSRRQECLEIL